MHKQIFDVTAEYARSSKKLAHATSNGGGLYSNSGRQGGMQLVTTGLRRLG